MTAERPSGFPWPPVLLLVCVAAAWLLAHLRPIAWPGLDDGPARFVGLGFGVFGIGLMTWAIRTLRHHNTTVRPDRGSDTLVTSGPYHWLRNPIYLADVFLMFALAEMTKNIWFAILALVFSGLVTWLAILPEEAHLEARFGDAYRNYKATARRWI
ncbi:MAG: isoprenylcysteine carboxylmethyltransferase family protein [Alphaproteobacteria bacterium]|nr:isoprenylcysteine carboxylmethyltransferase family protein [Alphaproteobacteria bacterium]